MPTVCEPWPGKRSASLTVEVSMLLQCSELDASMGEASLFRGTGNEYLVGFRGDDTIKRKLPRAMSAQLEQQAGAMTGVGVDCIHQSEPRCAVQVCGVGDG